LAHAMIQTNLLRPLILAAIFLCFSLPPPTTKLLLSLLSKRRPTEQILLYRLRSSLCLTIRYLIRFRLRCLFSFFFFCPLKGAQILSWSYPKDLEPVFKERRFVVFTSLSIRFHDSSPFFDGVFIRSVTNPYPIDTFRRS